MFFCNSFSLYHIYREIILQNKIFHLNSFDAHGGGLGMWSIHLFEVTHQNIFLSLLFLPFIENHSCFVETSEQASGQRNVEIALCWNQCVQCVCAPEALLRLSHSGVIFILCRHTSVTSLKDPLLLFLTLRWTLLEMFLENHSIVFLPQIACYSIVHKRESISLSVFFCNVEYHIKRGRTHF